MGIIELLVVVLVILWLLGYFGRGRIYARGVDGGADSNLVHTLLVIALILIVLRVLRLL
ncbi:MAG: DUF5670 family protein [Candidatus Limnocylindria bacterium]|nr:DUF5670 family protein [Candidatus Limnocylindria bacterium]